MRNILWFFTVFTVVGVGTAQAQTDPKRWEVSGSVGLLEARPLDNTSQSHDDWYGEARYAAAISHYWTENLKTEVEFATSREGSTYEFLYPNSFEALHRLDQVSARMVWLFGRNQWVHPYVSGGVVGDRARHRAHVSPRYEYPPGRTSGPMILVPESLSEPTVDYQVGFTAGAGAKFYMSQNAFFNTGLVCTYSRAAGTISFLAGFGVDF